MKVFRDLPSIKEAALRCIGLRCPVCGRSSILKLPFQIKDHCESCRALFKREEGFFVGAILINIVTTELVILLACALWIGLIGARFEVVLPVLFILALLFPIAFYNHSWSIWLTFDHFVERLPEA